MNRYAALALSILLSAFLAPGLTACHHADVDVGITGDQGYYDYDYYPDSEVYFYPSGGVYYWRDHDQWRHGRDLPRTYNLQRQSHVPLHLRTANPYEQHAQIRAQHPATHREEEHH